MLRQRQRQRRRRVLRPVSMSAVAGSRASITDVIIDCEDPERLAAFWAAVLDRPVSGRQGPYVWLARENGLGVGFQRVSEPKRGKNRVHIDVAFADVPAAVRTVEGLGGRRVGGYEDCGFLVMADPEGNEFCLIPDVPFDLDAEGCTTYLRGLSI